MVRMMAVLISWTWLSYPLHPIENDVKLPHLCHEAIGDYRDHSTAFPNQPTTIDVNNVAIDVSSRPPGGGNLCPAPSGGDSGDATGRMAHPRPRRHRHLGHVPARRLGRRGDKATHRPGSRGRQESGMCSRAAEARDQIPHPRLRPSPKGRQGNVHCQEACPVTARGKAAVPATSYGTRARARSTHSLAQEWLGARGRPPTTPTGTFPCNCTTPIA